MKTTKTVACTITALLMLSLIALSASATVVPTFTVTSLSQLPIVLPAETVFNGSILVSGTIRFWISDPSGAQIVNLGLVDDVAAFSFVAKQDGNYTFNFENDLPSSNPVQVTFSFVTDPDIDGGGNPTGVSLGVLPIMVVIAVVGSVAIFFIIRRKNKKHTAATKSHSAPYASPLKTWLTPNLASCCCVLPATYL
jgi:hypothetical protein